MQLRKLLRLRSEEGQSDRSVAKILEMSKTTVGNYYQAFLKSELPLEEVLQLKDSDLEELFYKNPVNTERYKTLMDELPYLEKELGKRGVDKKLLWLEYQERHPEGYYAYSQFCHRLRQALYKRDLSVYLNHKAGDKLFVDFAGGKLSLKDRTTGEMREVEVLVTVLPYSGLCYAEAVESQKLPHFLRGLENALEYMGGVPALIVPDNMKTAVAHVHRYEPSLNRTFEDFCTHYGTTAFPTRAASPKDKAHVENMVKIVYKKVFAPIRNEVFFDLYTLNQRIRELIEKLNSKPLTNRKESRRDLFETGEREELRPFPATRYEPKRYETKKVDKFCFIHISEDKSSYSVPYAYVGEMVEIAYSDRQLDIFHDNQKIAYHVRTGEKQNLIPEHLPPQYRPEALEWNVERILAKGAAIGPETADYLKGLIANSSHPQVALRKCIGILSFAKAPQYGPFRLNNACRKATRYKNYRYDIIETMLKKGHDRPAPSPVQHNLPLHENLRNDYN